jgi:predicted nuclease of restriction endonuclease-like (RecB) superfamily
VVSSILQQMLQKGWGTKVIDRLAKDLQTEFPGVEGFSPRSLKYMRSFAEAWTEEPIVQQLAAQLPWGHHMVLLDRLKDQPTREWFVKAAVEHGWSRSVLVHHISAQLQERQGKALTNFSRTLPPEDSDLAEQILKDPYNFDFLTLASTAKERELERGCSLTCATSYWSWVAASLSRQSGAVGGGWPELLYRPAFLSSPPALLLRDRT